MKIYLGYYPYYAFDDVYQPVYELAKKHRVPVVFHTGDTYAEGAILKYAHPLTIDEVAVKHRDVTFVMAHLGDPWCLTAAEVMYKNRNVYADLSGLIVGTTDKVAQHMKKKIIHTSIILNMRLFMGMLMSATCSVPIGHLSQLSHTQNG